MPIRSRLNIKQLDGIEKIPKLLIDASEDEIHNLAKDIQRDLEPLIENDLKVTPNTPKSPFVWSNNVAANERARRWWFYHVRKGLIPTDGSHYIRTGKLGRSFTFTLKRKDEAIQYVLQSTNEGRFVYRFVVGTFDKSRNYQIVGHKETKWWLIRDKRDKWFTEFKDRLLKQLPNLKIDIRNR